MEPPLTQLLVSVPSSRHFALLTHRHFNGPLCLTQTQHTNLGSSVAMKRFTPYQERPNAFRGKSCFSSFIPVRVDAQQFCFLKNQTQVFPCGSSSPIIPNINFPWLWPLKLECVLKVSQTSHRQKLEMRKKRIYSAQKGAVPDEA